MHFLKSQLIFDSEHAKTAARRPMENARTLTVTDSLADYQYSEIIWKLPVLTVATTS